MVYTRKISRPRQLGRGSFVPNSPLPNWQSVYYSRLCTSILNVPSFKWRTVAFESAGLFDESFCRVLLNKLEPNNITANGIIASGMKGFDRGLCIYCLKNNYLDPRVTAVMEMSLLSPNNRAQILNELLFALGEENPLMQHYMFVAANLANQAMAYGGLSVHLNMMLKSRETVVHHARSLTPGCVLNVEMLRLPRPQEVIHMRRSVWYKLFDILKVNRTQALKQLQDDIVSYEYLEEKCRSNPILLELLDPDDSVCAPPKVTSYSQMMREVLVKAQEDAEQNPINLDIFVQLLVNCTACGPGKMDGVTAVFMALKYDKRLAENDLRSAAFQEGLRNFLNHELRRFREGTLSWVAKTIAKSTDPHNIYYLRGVLGREVGLLFTNEVQSMDPHAGVNHKLLAASKQELLDVFYQYYKVDDLLERVRHILSTGGIQVLDAQSQDDITTKIISNILKDNGMDEDGFGYNREYVVLNEHGRPIGFTTKAAQELLLYLGILNAVSDK